MARSTKIYLVWIVGEKLPDAAFTVKHEALSYIRRTFSVLHAVKLYSGADGRNEGWQELEIER